MKWIGEYQVNANDVDVNSVLSASNMLRYMQDAANRSMEEDGPSYDELFHNGYSFILSRIRMSLYAPVRSHETLSVETWACESRGAQFNRCYRVLRGGIIVAEAVSVWALCGVADHRLHRVSEFNLGYRMDEMLELDQPARFKIPDTVSLRLVGERTVEYADIDLNGHMNNTKYPDILCGYTEDMRGQRVVSIALSFVNEAPLHETLKIYSASGDGVSYVRTIRENGQVNAEAEIIMESI